MYFVTSTIVGWIDLFTRTVYREILVDSFRYAQQKKGLNVYAWVIMTNHFHAILSNEVEPLNKTLQHLKAHTSKELVNAVKSVKESRRDWLLDKFSFEAQRTQRGKKYKVWQDGLHPIELAYHDNNWIDQKLTYIHANPVKAGFVSEPEHYLYSSAIDYAGGKGLLDVEVIL